MDKKLKEIRTIRFVTRKYYGIVSPSSIKTSRGLLPYEVIRLITESNIQIRLRVDHEPCLIDPPNTIFLNLIGPVKEQKSRKYEDPQTLSDWHENKYQCST